MTRAILIPACCIALMFAATASRAQYDPRMDAVLEELHHLRQSVDELTREVKQLREQTKQAAAQPAASTRSRMPEMRGSDQDALDKIVFPADPTPDALRAYIREIQRASQHQRSFSPQDPQVDMLMRVGAEHLEILLAATGRDEHGMGAYHIREAVIIMAGPEHKELVLEYLPGNPKWARVVTNMSWEEDARDILIDKIAAEHGIRDALTYMIQELADPQPQDEWTSREWRSTVSRILPFRGSTQNLVKWYEENHERLQYDPSTRKYVLAE